MCSLDRAEEFMVKYAPLEETSFLKRKVREEKRKVREEKRKVREEKNEDIRRIL